MERQWIDKIFAKDLPFEELALEIFLFQYNHNPVYKRYVDALRISPLSIVRMQDIPFLPIRFFKSHEVKTGSFDPQLIFESSGTTGSINSRHLVKEPAIYRRSFTEGFELFYGLPEEWCVIGLLPSYLERQNSSLVYMVNDLIRQSRHTVSGFYLNEYDRLTKTLAELERKGQKTLLIGVTFGLLDFASKNGNASPRLKNTTVMETGGMKGRGKELVRQEVHELLKDAWNLPTIHSEYGMTELLSQAYSAGMGMFRCPPWMKIVLRDEEDPLSCKIPSSAEEPITGAINIIDLANIYSCSFIATDDAGRLFSDGRFEVLGRLDNSDIRGCSLMVI